VLGFQVRLTEVALGAEPVRLDGAVGRTIGLAGVVTLEAEDLADVLPALSVAVTV